MVLTLERPATEEEIRWKSDFRPAIRPPVGQADSVRLPEWFVIKYNHKGEVLLKRILDQIGMEHHVFKFLQKRRRKPPVIMPWLPGYMFVRFDVELDFWQQLLDMPHVIEVLGSPVPRPLPAADEGSFEDLVKRLPTRFGKSQAYASVAVGQDVLITAGIGKGHAGKVTWSSPKRVKVIIMMFGQPIEAELSSADVKTVKA